MGEREDGGPAFPQLSVEATQRDGHGDVIEPFTSAYGGMTLRDWFAGQAMTFAYERAGTANQNDLKRLFGDLGGLTREEITACLAYEFADAMIAARGGKDG